MGLLDRLFHRVPSKWKYAPMMNGYAPIYSQFGTDIYASDVVQQCLKCIVDEIKKLNPTHIRMMGNDPVPMTSNVQSVLDNPNPLMTTSEFLEKTTWLLLLNYNVFIIPTYKSWKNPTTGEERRYYDGLWPIKPTQVDFIEDASGTLYVKFNFEGGNETTFPYDRIIHIKYNYSVNEFMGGDQTGQPDHRPLLKTLDLNQKLLQGVARAMNASYAINGIVKFNTMMDDGKMEAAISDFEGKLNRSESGFLPIDLKAEFVPMEHHSELVDPETLKFIDTKILRNWGVPLAILAGDYTKVQYNAFYQKTLEPLVIAISQAFTKKIFTDRERSYRNEIKLYPKDLIFLTVEQTIEMVTLLSNTGAIFENEKRTAFGLRPIPELEGKRYISLNWIDANNAADYQVGKTGSNPASNKDNQKISNTDPDEPEEPDEADE